MDRKDKGFWLRMLHKVLPVVGFVCIIVGLVGLVLPVIPGIALIIIGLVILGEESVVTGWILNRLPASLQTRIRKHLRTRNGTTKSGAQEGS